MKKTIATALIAIAFTHPSGLIHAADPTSLSALIEIALSKNPDIRASEARWEMFKSRAHQAGRFDDPMMMLGIQNGMVATPFDFRSDPSTSKVIGLSQNVPFFGKREMKKRIATAEAESYRWLLQERQLELARMVRETYYQLFTIERAIELTQTNMRVLEDIAKIAQARYAAGTQSNQELITAELEKARLVDAQLQLEQQRIQVAAALNTLLSQPTDDPIPATNAPNIIPPQYTPAELIGLSEASRPLIQSYKSLLEKSHAGQNLADREFYPDFTVSAEYMQRDATPTERGDDMYSLRLTFNLPFQREKRHAARQEAASETAMIREELNALRNATNSTISTLYSRIKTKGRQLALYEQDLLPKGRQSLELSIIDYRTGKADLLTVLERRTMLLEAEKGYYTAIAEYGQMNAELLAAVGVSAL